MTSSPRRILLIGNDPTSMHRLRAPLIRALVARGDRVEVATPAGGPFSEAPSALPEVPHHRFPLDRTGTSAFADSMTLASLFGLVARRKPTDVIAYTVKPVVWGGLALRAFPRIRFHAWIPGLGFPFVSRTESARRVRVVVRGLYRVVLPRADTVTFHNRDDATLFRTLGVVRDAQIRVVRGSGVPLDEFPCRPMPGGAPVLLMAARLREEKGVREFVQAAEAIRAKHPDVRFRLVGPQETGRGSLPPNELEGWVRAGLLQYDGVLAQPECAIRASHVLVHPSYREGLPRVVLEAMATGRPVVTTDAPGCRGLVDEGVTGFLSRARDAGSLADAIERALASRERWAIMGARARAHVESHYSADDVAQDMLNKLGWGVAQARKPAYDHSKVKRKAK